MLAEVALICNIDICQAAVLLPKKLDGVSLLSFTPDLINEIYVSHPLVIYTLGGCLSLDTGLLGAPQKFRAVLSFRSADQRQPLQRCPHRPLSDEDEELSSTHHSPRSGGAEILRLQTDSCAILNRDHHRSEEV
jgi:hypothetical protein